MRLAWQVSSVEAIDMVARVSVWRHWIGLRGPLRINPHDDKSPASSTLMMVINIIFMLSQNSNSK